MTNHCIYTEKGFTKILEQFDDLRSRPIIKNNIKLRLNSLFPNKTQWEDQNPVKKILFSEIETEYVNSNPSL